jgi:hypothetical protein
MMMALMMAAGLAGCGSADEAVYEPDSTSTSKKEEKDTVSTSKNKDNASMTLSEAIHDGEYTIWYSASEVDKDEEPTIYVLYDDGTCISGKKLDGEAYTFRELSEMSDEDIVSHVQSIWKKKKENEAALTNEKTIKAIEDEKGFMGYYDYLSGDSSSVEEEVAAVLVDISIEMGYEYGYYLAFGEFYDEELSVDEQDEAVKAIIEERYNDFWLSLYQSDKQDIWIWDWYDDMGRNTEFFKSVEEQYIEAASAACDSEFAEVETASANYDERGTYTIAAETDSTGNNIETETIKFTGQYNKSVTPNLSSTNSITISSTLSPQTILESYYGGYSGDDGLFVMRTGSNTQFTLDTKDTEGITVD